VVLVPLRCSPQCAKQPGVAKTTAVGHLERFVADWEREQPLPPVEKKRWRKEKAAITGSTPAGLPETRPSR
jgi:NADPH-dependent glutamate synthase beta subunit-like oxidoreductase